MYICVDCKEVFSEPAEIEEDFGWDTEYGRNSAMQSFWVCPCCGSDCLEEAGECIECGNYFSKDNLHITDDCEYICLDCYNEMEEEQK